MTGIKNKYIRFVVNGFMFFTLVFIMDLLFGNALRHFYFKQKSGSNYHLIYSIDSTEAQVIILGSSRAVRHYIPDIIEDKLKLTCFNTGLDGNYIFNNYAVFKSILLRYTPKIVLMDINPDEIYLDADSQNSLASILPFYKIDKEIKSVILLKSKFENLKLSSKIYPFNSSLFSIATGILKTEDINKLKGYMPLYGSLSDTIGESSKGKNRKVDPRRIKVLETVASDCLNRKVRLIFIQSPRYKKVSQEKSVSIINELSTKYSIEFWDYVNDTTFLKPYYFKDGSHMNDLGAHKFTEAIAERMRQSGNNGGLNPAGQSK